MLFKQLSPMLSVAPQLSGQDIEAAARRGFRTIISNRPDNEDACQMSAAEVSARAAPLGLAFAHVPVAPGAISEADIANMRSALATAEGPVLAFCRTGTRSATLWALAMGGQENPDTIIATAAMAGYDLESIRPRLTEEKAGATGNRVYDVVVVGGGSAGVAVAASLLRREPGISVAIVDPAKVHFYQPGWTMVGAGVFQPETTRRAMADVMPHQATWIAKAAAAFRPEQNELVLEDRTILQYRKLIVCPGIKLDWAAIPGLLETLGYNGVTSNYRYNLAPVTRDLVARLYRGRAIFTQPPMPIKCAGAPQKAMYLSCDHWRQAGVLGDVEVEFHNAAGVLFGVPDYVPALMEYIRRYGIDLRLGSRLVSVDGGRRIATFERPTPEGEVERIERSFDLLHVVPPQIAPDFVRSSPLADESGFIAVDHATLRHPVYANVFALGDACAAPNAKTAAAVRKQAPVVAVNVLAALDDRPPVARYDGYGSCPLTVERGRIVLAEFGYGGKLLPTFPPWLLNGKQPTRAAWFLKSRLLPQLYWKGMLKGHEWLARPEPAAEDA